MTTGMANAKASDYLSDCVRPGTQDVSEQVLMIMTVRTVDGLERRHTYPLPGGYEICMEQWNAALSAVQQAVGDGSPVMLSDPTVVYNGAHIVTVEYSFVGASAVVERIPVEE